MTDRPSPRPVVDPLSVTALDTERHVARSGWDQNPRLFALVPTEDLLEREPHLRGQMSGGDLAPGALTAIEQEDLPRTANLESLLGRLTWPETVAGVALAIERVVVPPDAERDLPTDPEAAVEALQKHPAAQEPSAPAQAAAPVPPAASSPAASTSAAAPPAAAPPPQQAPQQASQSTPPPTPQARTRSRQDADDDNALSGLSLLPVVLKGMWHRLLVALRLRRPDA